MGRDNRRAGRRRYCDTAATLSVVPDVFRLCAEGRNSTSALRLPSANRRFPPDGYRFAIALG
ncbi:hypothetical protein KCP73_14455 [Salmonella enterica subsp. enterica]|nr:hypothetical protein KCP73_14455 [Salmonella enterica subsp. enterica]